jgi:bifunctional DNA-binding transcriptional regulator/antitoxin component of YhaV-PrlF toxin-antitoxin module
MDAKRRTVVPKEVREFCSGKELFIVGDEKKGTVKLYDRDVSSKLPTRRLRWFFPLKEMDAQLRLSFPEPICRAVLKGSKEILWEGWKDYWVLRCLE